MKFLTRFFNRGRASVRPDTSDRETMDVSSGLTPLKVDAIMRAANGGDTREQCRLASELLEHNIEIAQAVSTRINAVLGLPWSFQPGDDSPAAKHAAEALTEEIRNIDGSGENFEDLLEDLMGALLPGFAISEILWDRGGHIVGFNHIEQRHFTFMDGYTPRLVTDDAPKGIDLPPASVIYHRFRFHGKDPARGGLIRPLAWFHCFNNGTDKNLLAFMERYGMPFLVVRVDESTWQKERHNIKDLIRNFGSSGGGLFSKGTEQELLQAANSDGNIYFRMKEYLAGAVNRLILGQNASSGDGGGLSKDGAQDKVRRDILESDCRQLQRTVNTQLCIPWTRFNFADTPAPRFVIDCAAPEDLEQLAETVALLAGAGIYADARELSERFGMNLRFEKPPAGQPFGMSDADPEPPGLRSWLGPMAQGIAEAAEMDDNQFDRMLKNGLHIQPGSSDKYESCMAAEMIRRYHGRKIQG